MLISINPIWPDLEALGVILLSFLLTSNLKGQHATHEKQGSFYRTVY